MSGYLDNPVRRVAAKFGGQTALGRAIGRRQSVVSKWVANGRIPSEHIPLIIEAATMLVPPVHLQPNDFFAPVHSTPQVVRSAEAA